MLLGGPASVVWPGSWVPSSIPSLELLSPNWSLLTLPLADCILHLATSFLQGIEVPLAMSVSPASCLSVEMQAEGCYNSVGWMNLLGRFLICHDFNTY
jgi:hypothetical protein